MTTSKHTPGPWAVGRKVSNMVYGRDGLDIICQCDTMGEESRHVENANAKLIATAPELVQTLLGVRTDLLRTDFRSEADRAAYMIDYIERVLVKAGI